LQGGGWGDANPLPDADAFTDSGTNADSNSNTETDTDSDSNTETNSNADPNSHTHSDSHTNSNSDPDSGSGDCTTLQQQFNVTYSACADISAGVWRMRVSTISGNVDISIHTGGSRDPDANPPTTQAEAVDAVTVMKGYYARGSRGSWHTAAASIAHESHHYSEWKCSSEHYWPAAKTDIETLTLPLASAADATAAAAAMKTNADSKVAAFYSKATTYFGTLGDGASDRPYAAGQLALNSSIQRVQTLATTKGWTVPSGVDSPSTTPVCYQPFT
jgi:hypothetical protein